MCDTASDTLMVVSKLTCTFCGCCDQHSIQLCFCIWQLKSDQRQLWHCVPIKCYRHWCCKWHRTSLCLSIIFHSNKCCIWCCLRMRTHKLDIFSYAQRVSCNKFTESWAKWRGATSRPSLLDAELFVCLSNLSYDNRCGVQMFARLRSLCDVPRELSCCQPWHWLCDYTATESTTNDETNKNKSSLKRHKTKTKPFRCGLLAMLNTNVVASFRLRLITAAVNVLQQIFETLTDSRF